jgi:predicted RNA methylase
MQDTGKFRTNAMDQFYTSPTVAASCIALILKHVPHANKCVWVEPSAGNGSFLHNVPPLINKIGIDLDPKSPDILKHDYLEWSPATTGTTDTTPMLVFGNPPFGRQSSLAKAFIAKSCTFADAIAFILPKSFTKPSMFNAFDLKFHCVHSAELSVNSFVLNSAPYDVPCVFQIWQKKTVNRPMEVAIPPIGFQYIKVKVDDSSSEHHVAFRRVGGHAGKCFVNDGTTSYNAQSHHFLKFDDACMPFIGIIVEKINAHTFPSNTVGPRSLSKSEINTVLNDIVATTTQ